MQLNFDEGILPPMIIRSEQSNGYFTTAQINSAYNTLSRLLDHTSAAWGLGIIVYRFGNHRAIALPCDLPPQFIFGIRLF